MYLSSDEAIEKLLCDEVVALPTETVYGLAASLFSERAIANIYRLKNRPQDNPLIVHVNSIEMAQELCFWNSSAEKLAKAFWPGPLTLVLEAKEKMPLSVRCGLNTVAIRMPNHPTVLDIIKKTGPLVAPSANISGRPSSTSVSHVQADFGKDFPVVDGGVCKEGVESTIILCFKEKPLLARLGALSTEAIEEVIQEPLASFEGDKIITPGQKYRHYAPAAQLILSELPLRDVPSVIGFFGRDYPGVKKVYILGSLEDDKNLLCHLYRILRQIDEDGQKVVFVDYNFPKTGHRKVLAERLKKASS